MTNPHPAARIKELEAECDRLRELVDSYLKGLVFYASEINWNRYDGMDAKLIRDDRGFRARAALGKGEKG